MNKCENCYLELASDSIFCGQCGQRLKLPDEHSLSTSTRPGAGVLTVRHTPAFSQDTSVITCERCYCELPGWAVFCGRCGHRLKLPDEHSEDASTHPGVGQLATLDTPVPLQDVTLLTQPLPEQALSAQQALVVEKEEEFEHELLNAIEPDEFSEQPPTVDQTDKPVQDEDEDEDDEVVVLPLLFEPARVPQAQVPLSLDTVPSVPPPEMPPALPQPTMPVGPPSSGVSVPTPSAPPADSTSAHLLSVHAPPQAPPTGSMPLQPPSAPKLPKPKLTRPPCLVAIVAIFVGIGVLIYIFLRPPQVSFAAKVDGRRTPGETIMLRGHGFPGGETLIITVDGPYRVASADNVQSMNAGNLRAGQQVSQYTSSVEHGAVLVGADGVFAFPYFIDRAWLPGSPHTFYIYDHNGKLLKEVPFDVTSTPSENGLTDCANFNHTEPVNMGSLIAGTEQPLSKDIPLCTEGSGTIDWKADWDLSQSWFSTTPAGQLTAPEVGALTLHASANGLKPGAYTVDVQLSSEQGPRKLPFKVVFTILKQDTSTNPVSTPPAPINCVSVVPQALSFTAVTQQPTAVQQRVQINNCGDVGTWGGAASTKDGASWLSTDVTEGALSAGGIQDAYVKASALHLQPGTYTGQVTFRIRDSVVVIPVTLEVLKAQTPVYCITNDKSSLTFYSTVKVGDPEPQRVMLINCGTGGHWSSTRTTDDGTDWLRVVARSNDLLEGGTESVEISASSTQLHDGRYTGEITFTLGSGITRVGITFIVQNPCVKVISDPLVFKITEGEGDPPSLPVKIYNCGAEGYWYAAPSTNNSGDWLHPDENHGLLGSGQDHSMTVRVSGSQLKKGNYTGSIVFATGFYTTSVPVTFIVAPKAQQDCLQVSPQKLTFTLHKGQGNPDPQKLTLFNCGHNTGTWDVRAPRWLSIVAPNKTLERNQVQQIRVVPSIEGFDVGKHEDTIVFGMGSAPPVTVAVTLSIEQPKRYACIQVDHSSLTFDSGWSGSATMVRSVQLSSSQTQTVKITNCGNDGILLAKPNRNDKWLQLKLPEGDTALRAGQSTFVPFTVDLSQLKVHGSYEAIVPFIIKVDENTWDREPVRVVLKYTKPDTKPQLCFADPSSLTFTSTSSEKTITLEDCGANATWTSSDDSHGVLYVSPGTAGRKLDGTGSGSAKVKVLGKPSHAGSHSYTLTFTTSQGARVDVPVRWEVQAPDHPCIKVASTPGLVTLTKGAPFHTRMGFTNCGANPGRIWISSPWLNVGSQNGSINGSHSYPTSRGPDVDVSMDTTSLEPREYPSVINARIESEQGTYEMAVPITLKVVQLSHVSPPQRVVNPGPTETPVPVVTPTPTPTKTPTATPKPTVAPTKVVTPTPTPTATPRPVVTPTPTPTATLKPVVTPTPTPTATPRPVVTPTPTPTATPRPVVTPTPTPTATPRLVVTPTPTATRRLVVTPTPTPTAAPRLVVTPTPTPRLVVTPTPIPTATPKPIVTPTPTPKPVVTPTPTPKPVVTPTPTPTPTPKPKPTREPKPTTVSTSPR